MHGLMMDAPLLITEIMRFAERNFADTEIVSVTFDQPRHRTTWREVFRRARKLANALQAAGVQRGDRIGTLAWNDYRHLELYYAVSCMGAVLHTVNPRLFPEQLEFIINHAEDKLLFVDATLLPVLASLQGKLPTVERTIVMTDAASMPPAVAGKLPDYESFIAGHSEAFDWPVLDERSASSLCYTSGTTGHPKGVLYSHRSTVLHAYGGCMMDSLGLSGADCVLAVVPMFHANAWGLPYNAPMTGARLVFPGPRMGDAPTLTRLMNDEGVTLAAAVPTVWTMLLNHLQQSGEKLKTLRRTVIGGSAVPLQMIRAFRDRHGVTVIQGWGMTETSPLGSVSTLRADQLQLPEEEQVQLRGKAGHGIFGISMKIVGDDGKELPWDGVSAGELKVSGPWVCGGYFRLDRSPAHAEPGWFATGDVAVIHPNGFLQITDRAKDVIKSGGEWISSVDLENCACGHPEVLMAAAIGVRHPKWDERPVLLVVPRPGCAPGAESVLEHLAQHFAKWQLPDTVVFVEALPLTATGKINKRSLRETYGHVLMEQTGTS
ncbi:MAG TPA: long-chain-fatty-acid--CoA ligase [Steroidobacteraceae bacterium]|nr:long-chain-fatty-acid--CoA ligase [Steroidobacteraceae bacterium]